MNQAKQDVLAVVIPVFNEEGAIEGVLRKWIFELGRLSINYKIHVYNDGSKDNTLRILRIFSQNNPEIIVHDKPNSGHGPTILKGYLENLTADWIFQVDSDDEMGPESFVDLWQQRSSHDFLLGKRSNRISSIPRLVISWMSRICVRVFYGDGIYDVNSPYRLMRVSVMEDALKKIPSDTFAPNVLISGIICRKGLRRYETPVSHKNRQTGEVSIKKWRLFKSACKSFWQTACFSFTKY